MDNQAIKRVYNKMVKPALAVAGVVAIMGLTCNEGAKIYKGALNKDLHSGVVHKGDWVYDLVSHSFYIGSKDSPKNRYITTYGDYHSLKQKADSLPIVRAACIDDKENLQKSIEDLSKHQVSAGTVAHYLRSPLNVVDAFNYFKNDSIPILENYSAVHKGLKNLDNNAAKYFPKKKSTVVPKPDDNENVKDDLMSGLRAIEKEREAVRLQKAADATKAAEAKKN